MKVTFCYYSPESRVPHISVDFGREVEVLPRAGDRIAHHQESRLTIFEVREVLHVYEDRESYKAKSYGGDRVYVTLIVVPRERSSMEFNQLLEQSGVRSETGS